MASTLALGVSVSAGGSFTLISAAPKQANPQSPLLQNSSLGPTLQTEKNLTLLLGINKRWKYKSYYLLSVYMYPTLHYLLNPCNWMR